MQIMCCRCSTTGIGHTDLESFNNDNYIRLKLARSTTDNGIAFIVRNMMELVLLLMQI